MRVGFWFGQSGLRDEKWELAEGEAEETRTPSSGPWVWRGETGAHWVSVWTERCHSHRTPLTLRVTVKQSAKKKCTLRHSCTGTLIWGQRWKYLWPVSRHWWTLRLHTSINRGRDLCTRCLRADTDYSCRVIAQILSQSLFLWQQT